MSRLKSYLWIIWAFVPFLNWVGFGWIAFRARRRAWALWSAVYLIPTVGIFVLPSQSRAIYIDYGFLVSFWVLSIVHAMLAAPVYGRALEQLRMRALQPPDEHGQSALHVKSLPPAESEWTNFLRMGWKAKAPIGLGVGGVFLGMLLVGVFSETKSSSKSLPVESASSATTATARPATSSATTAVSATPTATVAPTSTIAPTSTPAAPPTDTPAPTSTPVPPSLEEQMAKSYRDNKNFMARTTTDGLSVAWDGGGLVILELYPKTVLSDGDILTIASASAVVASKAIWTTYLQVDLMQVDVRVEFTDQFGKKSVESAALLTITRSTGEKFVYDGLRDRVISDNKILFCAVDHYRIHPSVYAKLGNKGCLADWGFSK